MDGSTPISAFTHAATRCGAMARLAVVLHVAATADPSLLASMAGSDWRGERAAAWVVALGDVGPRFDVSDLRHLLVGTGSASASFSAVFVEARRTCARLLAVDGTATTCGCGREGSSRDDQACSARCVRRVADVLDDMLDAGSIRPLDRIRRGMQLGWKTAAAELYVSGKIAAGQPTLLDAFGITHVITCFRTGAAIDVGVGCGRQRLVLHCVDDDVYDMTKDFEVATDFVRCAVAAAAAGGAMPCRVLVHCSAGMHRSTAVLAAVAVKLLGAPLEDVLLSVAAARPMAVPTDAFARQLRRLAGPS